MDSFPGLSGKEMIMRCRSRSKGQNEYEAWVIARGNDKKSLCRYFRGRKCVPTHDEHTEAVF